eukprot:COSAG03_NODE_276_length_9556_cov_8.462360_9_plen_33_part_00
MTFLIVVFTRRFSLLNAYIPRVDHVIYFDLCR